jgi:ABC-type transport system involved in multi-copper enzyme maturation permease subunit
MLPFAQHLYRLAPANPILLRVVAVAGKRRRDMLIRIGYLGVLVAWVSIMLLGMDDLSKAAKKSTEIFRDVSYVQLFLLALLAPVFTAGAITQEKDSQTYDILLTTPLTNGQIVLGTLLSRVFFMIALLLSGLPVFMVTLLFGGVALDNVLISFGIAAATAFLMGAVAIAIATFRLGTRRTIFFFYLAIIAYLVGVAVLNGMEWVQIPGLPQDSPVTCLTALHPFLTLQASFSDPLLEADLPASLRHWPVSWYLTSPHGFYITTSCVVGLVLVLPSIVLLRRVAQATQTPKQWILTKLRITRGNAARKPRYVWHNPVAWREARTKASAARMGLLRLLLIAAGCTLAGIILWQFSTPVMPTRYLDAAFVNPAEGSLTISQQGRAPTYRMAPNFSVRFEDRVANVDQLRGRYAVSDVTLDPRDKNAVQTLSLAPVGRLMPLPDTQKYLLALLLVEIAICAVVVTNEAAATVTREREDGSLDLLLTTPITSRFYIWGKLRGLVSLAWPLNAVPVATILVFVVYDIWRWLMAVEPVFRWVVLPESLLLVPVMLVLVSALAAIVGMHTSMRARRTMAAVMLSVLAMAAIIGLPALIATTALSTGYRSNAPLAVAAFSPVATLCVLVDATSFGGQVLSSEYSREATGGRWTLFFTGLVAAAIYAAVVYGLYRSMVRNFDMMIRKQQR